ncbi:paramyosin-like [Aricia agestis]|uniref:paramyosin-like n=1 Tax=Aricia agestis TaxID=91739 RepID=UPI001C207700|nr:paramyosin-like [Aricia agestis]
MENSENTFLQALQAEVNFYRENQVVVEQEIKTLIDDNQKLSQQVGGLLKENLQYAQQTPLNDLSNEVEELKKQVSLVAKERDSLHVLWQTAQKTVDALETELEIYQNYSGRRNYQSKNEKGRDLELKVETAAADYLDLESKYKNVLFERNSLKTALKEDQKFRIECQEQNKRLLTELEAVKKDLDECRIELSAEKKSYETIKSELQACQKEYKIVIKREAEAKLKVAEALQLFDVVSSQKNDAHQKIAQITKDLENLRATLANIKRETEDKYRSELDEVKNNYNEKMSDMLQHIQNLDAELVEKGLLLNKALRETKILQTEIKNEREERKENLKAIDPKLALAEQRAETLFQELVASERRNIQLICEKQSIALDLQKTLDNYTRECKRRDWEETLLKTQCQDLKLQVDHLQKSLDETHDMINKLQVMLSSKTDLSEKMVFTREEEVSELNKHLEQQIELNKRWKESYLEMTVKLKQELESILIENRELRQQLNLPRSKEIGLASV